jgi:hypothetical protein
MPPVTRLDDSAAKRQMDRRAWMASSTTGLALAILTSKTVEAMEAEPARLEECKRELVRRLLYSGQDLDDWLAAKGFPFSKYDPELGYLHIDRDFKEGVDGSICQYRYDASGARRMSHHADQPCRINTYGNSFTSCEQVSDGETWQEVLAAHLGEPVRNFGIGGYSVYQAYLRMLREEQRTPAQYIVLNIFDDDHFRNLHGWQRPRFRVNRKSTNPPVPHVRVDPDAGTFVERPNPCPTAESLYQLCDFDSAWKIFADDYAVNRFARREALRQQGAADVPANDFDDADCTRRGLFATMRIVEMIEAFAARQHRRVLYVLSYGTDRVKRFINEQARFDQPLIAFLDSHKLPYVDLLAAHKADYAQFAPDMGAYLKRYYIGHYNPLGNFFCAFAIKDRLARTLDPSAPAYTNRAGEF